MPQHLALCPKEGGQVVVEQPHLEQGRLHCPFRGDERPLVGSPFERDQDCDRSGQRQEGQTGQRSQPVEWSHDGVEEPRQRPVQYRPRRAYEM